MAVNSYDATTGYPKFADGDAPDIKADPQAAALYASQVGTRLIGTTAERLAYAYAREGLGWYDTDLDAVFLHNGSGWAMSFQDWVSYTPTLTNMTGSAAASYQVVGQTVHVSFRITVATVGTTPSFSLPVNASDANVDFPNSMVMLADVSAGFYFPGLLRRISATTAEIFYMNATGTPAVMAAITGSVPFAWAAGDIIAANFSYRRAA